MNLVLSQHERHDALVAIVDGYPSLDVEMPPAVRQAAFRAWIIELEAFIAQFPQIEIPIVEHFTGTRYAREAVFPSDSIIIGKVHNFAHRCLVAGTCIVVSEHEIREIDGIEEFDSFPGAKRLIFNKSEVRWTTVHDVSGIKEDQVNKLLISESFEEFDRICETPLLLGEAS